MGSSESTWLRAQEANSRQYSWTDFVPKSCGEAYLQKDEEKKRKKSTLCKKLQKKHSSHTSPGNGQIDEQNKKKHKNRPKLAPPDRNRTNRVEDAAGNSAVGPVLPKHPLVEQRVRLAVDALKEDVDQARDQPRVGGRGRGQGSR